MNSRHRFSAQSNSTVQIVYCLGLLFKSKLFSTWAAETKKIHEVWISTKANFNSWFYWNDHQIQGCKLNWNLQILMFPIKNIEIGLSSLASQALLLVCETTCHIKAWMYIASKIRHLVNSSDTTSFQPKVQPTVSIGLDCIYWIFKTMVKDWSFPYFEVQTQVE